MKLELKHIVGYLPYGLTGISTDENQGVETVNGISWDQNKSIIELNTNIDAIDIIGFKPILRPMSDITKEIEVKGKFFVPAEYFWSIDLYDQQAFELYGTIPPYWKACIEVDIKDLDWGVIEKLYEWHFDVHGLIENNLAIDINTL